MGRPIIARARPKGNGQRTNNLQARLIGDLPWSLAALASLVAVERSRRAGIKTSWRNDSSAARFFRIDRGSKAKSFWRVDRRLSRIGASGGAFRDTPLSKGGGALPSG